MSPLPKPAEQKVFEGIDRAASRVMPGPWAERLLTRILGRADDGAKDWSASARTAINGQKLLRARGILYLICAVFGLLFLWAAFAPIDEVTKGEGKVIPSSQLQVVQSVDGGVVEAVYVKEGQQVRKGEKLVRIDPTRFVANFREGSARAYGLRVKAARLSALVNGTAFSPPAPEGDANGSGAEMILAQEQQYYHESRRQLTERVTMAQEQLGQRAGELREVEAMISTAGRSLQSARDELAITRPLLRTGAVSEMDVMRLEREVSRLAGERQQAIARRGQIMSSNSEGAVRVRDAETSLKNEWRAELTATMTELNSLGESVTGLADRVKKADIHSPVSGVVQRVHYNTIGGVVQPGHTVIEVVPTGVKMVVEAKVSPRDIAFLRPGLPAVIKFTAYDFAVYGGMDAKVTHISPDSITDDKGNTYYLVRAEAHQSHFGGALPIIPGMVVELDVITGKRTILSYILKPLLRAKQNALTER